MGSKLVYAASEDNNLYALSPVDGKEQWQFKTQGYIRASLAYASSEHRVFVGSSDGSLYCLYDLPQAGRESQMAWLMPHPTGAPILKTPVVSGGAVYVINDNKECHVVDAQSGKTRWILKNVSDFVARGDLNTYLRREGTLLAVDSASGASRWVLDTRPLGVTRILCNPTDGGIYLMRDDGSFICIRERHPEKAPEAKPAPAPEVKPAPAPAPKPAPAPAPKPAAP
jgi:outer membrane protein assembly factor BamB